MAKFLFFTLGMAAALQLNPITRVAELLDNLAKKVESDEKKEQDLYDGFKCWCMKVIDGKGASIETNEQRIAELNAYIDDLSSGRVELTSERGDLEGEIKSLENAISEETAMRASEKKDFDAAKDEMTKAIAALESAVSTMADGTNSSTARSLVGIKSKLKKAVRVGSGFLAKRDVQELMKALDVQEPDYEKLNTNNNGKYEHASGEIQDILGEMLNTFKDNLAEAERAEAKAKADSETLLAAKNTQLDDAQQAGLDQKVEMGARAAAKAESQTEADELTGQNERDKGFIADAKTTCATKASQWEERKRIRAGEKAAIAQTIATLRSDDARDLFKKSFSSQGKLLQTSVVHKPVHHRLQRGLKMMRKTAIKAGNMRLLTRVQNVEAKAVKKGEANPFEQIIKQCDEEIALLLEEEANDLREKEDCQKQRAEKTAEVEMKAKAIDTNTARIARFHNYVADAERRVEEIIAEIKALEEQKKDAEAQRVKEKAEFEQALEDDTKALEVVNNAKKVLEDFYARESLALGFVQVAIQTSAPGDAPTPPPSTWDEGGYKGAAGESGGVVGLMEMIAADIGKDIQKADAEEAEAVIAYEKLVADIDADILSLQTTKGGLEDAIAEDVGRATDQKQTRTTNQESMKATLDAMKAIAKSCDFMMANFDLRIQNRQEEMDGLNAAKASFQGAVLAN
jgi:hypothetical protein